MAIGAPVLGTATRDTSAQTTRNVVWPSPISNGDVATLVVVNASVSPSAVDTPSGFTQIDQHSGTANTAAPAVAMFRHTCNGTETGNLAVATPGGSGVVATSVLIIWPGVVTGAGGLDVAAVLDDKTVASTSFAFSGGIAPVTPGCTLLYVVTGNSTSITSTPLTGFTEAYDRTGTTRAINVGYLQNVAASNNALTGGTWSGSTKDVGIAIALKPLLTAVTGTLAVTLDGATLAASGTETITGSLAVTLAGATLAASGTETISGTLASTLAGATLAASGAVLNPVTGTLAVTLAGATLAATGHTGPADVTGILAATLAGATLAATGAETFTGTMSATLQSATLAASGTVLNPVTGTLAVTLEGAALSASGVETIQGALTVTLEGATLDAVGTSAFFRNISVTATEHRFEIQTTEHTRELAATEHRHALTAVDRS